jgi:hypothetical protein
MSSRIGAFGLRVPTVFNDLPSQYSGKEEWRLKRPSLGNFNWRGVLE